MTCQRARRDADTCNYAKVGQLDDDTNLQDVLGAPYISDSGKVVEVSWIAPYCLPGCATGSWYASRRGAPSQLRLPSSNWTQHYPLSLLHCCPGCHQIGHLRNSCRSTVCCSHCSGPHPYYQQDITCTRHHHCFQYGGSHRLYLDYCPFNQRAHQLYTTAASHRRASPPYCQQKAEETAGVQAFNIPQSTHSCTQDSSPQCHTGPS